MRKIIYLLFILIIVSCNNERLLQLPEIEKAEITEVLDVSPVYIFYDETQPDSTLFNRKNLIGTTNWLVNVDKRLKLKQAIPHLKYLQDKRNKESMHKNENAKNYFTCNDTSIKNLGFVEFTNVNYVFDLNFFDKFNSINGKKKPILVHFISKEYVALWKDSNPQQSVEEVIKIDSLFTNKYLNQFKKNKNQIQLIFDKEYSFQKYINLKYELSKFINEGVEISKDEIFF